MTSLGFFFASQISKVLGGSVKMRDRYHMHQYQISYSLQIGGWTPHYRIGSHGQMVTISAFQNFKMLAEDPSSILGGSTGTWEIPG